MFWLKSYHALSLGEEGKNTVINGILQLTPRYPKPRFYRKSQGVCVGNTLNQVFYTKQINVIWTGDISYIPTKQGWLYLAVVLDLCSRKVVGWACSDTPDTDLTERALL